MVPHAQHSHIQSALKMNGVFVKIEGHDFLRLINEQENLLIVYSKSGIFNNLYLYLTSYKGFIFYCKSKEQLPLPSKHEKIFSNNVTLPIM
jgi:hypothetical protein